MTKKKIYISGKITGLKPSTAKQAFDVCERKLTAQGYETVNPMNAVYDPNKTYGQAMKECIQLLLGCDAIYLMSNWQSSKGAILEHLIASSIGIEILGWNF